MDDYTRYAIKVGSGAMAGIIGTTAIFPLDLIKTRLQVETATLVTTAPSPWKMCRQMVRQGGFTSLYKGLSANLIGVTPEKAIKLVVNDGVREWMASRLNLRPDHLPIRYGAVAGGCAGLAQFVVTCPMERVKICMQLDPHKRPIMAHLRELGVKGLYRGGASTILRDLPFSTLIFPLHATLTHHLAHHQQDHFGAHLAAGMVAGAVSAFLVTPLDVVKTRIQGGRSVNVKDAVAGLWREGGWFRGAPQRVMIVSPLFGIALSVYELQQRLLLM